MNLPNKITVGRFALALGFFAFFVWADLEHATAWWKPLAGALVFGLAVVGDAFDGYYARKLGLQTDFGRIADPVVDKVIVSGGLILLAGCEWARPYFPPWMVVLIIGREFLVNGLRGFIEARGVAFPARWDGKLKMVLQCIAITVVMFVPSIATYLPEALRTEQQAMQTEEIDDSANRLEDDPLKAGQEQQEEEDQGASLEKDQPSNPKK